MWLEYKTNYTYVKRLIRPILHICNIYMSDMCLLKKRLNTFFFFWIPITKLSANEGREPKHIFVLTLLTLRMLGSFN